jgi:chromosome partitioning protein
MGRILAIANQKGGVGKTTTAVNLSAALAQLGRKVLIIDSDPQGNTTTGLGIDKGEQSNTLYNLLISECHLHEAVLSTVVDNLSLIPSNINLSGAEIELISFDKREYLLKRVLLNTKYLYDYLIIDCPPSLSLLTLNGLTAADSVLVPVQCEFYALEGLSQLIHTIQLVQKSLNKTLYIEGIVFTMYDARTNLSIQVVEEVKKYIDDNIYTAIIPRNVRLSEAPSHGLPITLYDKSSKGAESYLLLAKELIERDERKWQ